jgi:hypothetical protein
MNKQITSAVLAATMMLSSSAHATELPDWLDISGSVNFDVTSDDMKNIDAALRAQDAELRFEILAREGVKLVIKAELERVLNKYIKDENLDAELEKMIEEAYIQIETDKVSKLPRAIITVGKHRMAFAQRLAELPMFKDSLLYKLTNEEEMLGLTVALPVNFFKIVDEVAFSLYETGAGDFKISKDKGMTVRLSKKVTQQLELQISGMLKEHGTADKELRGSVGFVFTSNDGRWKVWAQGLVMEKSPEYVNSKYAGAIGAAMKLGAGAIVVEASTIENHAREVAVAYNFPVGALLILSPEVRYLRHENGSDETVVGIRARIEFGRKAGLTKGPRA